MKRYLLLLSVALLGIVACDDEKPTPAPTPDSTTVELSVDKNTIEADGIDAATFTVEVNGEVRTDVAVVNVADYSTVADNIFTTTDEGVYKFVAIYNKVASNEVSVTAQNSVVEQHTLTLTANRSTIINDGTDAAIFSVTFDGENCTGDAVVRNVTTDSPLEGYIFTSTTVGSYAFVAEYEGYTSEEFVVEVVEAGDNPTPSAYKPGDLYDENGVRGVVFYVNEDGNGGLIMSMDQAYLQWSTEYVWVNCTSSRGDWHTEDMLKLGADKYPAAKWCADHGEGWYMPSSDELRKMWSAVSNGTLSFDAEFVKLYNDKLTDPILEDYYWSSNEIMEDMAEVVVFINDSVICLEPYKDRNYLVRAVHKF